ncbi:MAG: GMC family oxidoreductase [Chloroflexi bacterium]|nr:GMC family oxidoreductase [Chloroflexota bacterium]
MPGFDVIVVGSGFGGAVTACRLAGAGARVLVLERGRRWTTDQYPRGPGDAWFYDHRQPHKHNGWLDLRLYPGMAVAQGAGVGGGSLCYSSVLMEADPGYFGHGWDDLTYAALQPHYQRAREMLGAQTIPGGQLTQRYKLLRQAAEHETWSARFAPVSLAVTFDPAWNYDLPDARGAGQSKSFTNAQGRKQGTCVHLGNCDLGCEVRAKNTLDLNYLAAAESAGAEVRPLHRVRFVRPRGTGYEVVFDRIHDGRLLPGTERAEHVVLAAGSLGSTELLLRSRDQYATLPMVSRVLGRGWSANANVLTPDVYANPAEVQQSVGPTITSSLDFMDGSFHGQRIVVEDDGFPNLLLNAIRAHPASKWANPLAWLLRARPGSQGQSANPFGGVMVWLGAGVDAGNGRLRLKKSALPPWQADLTLNWSIARSRRTIEAILQLHKRLSAANGGRLQIPLYWSWLHALVTVHPLGGCRIGHAPSDGVVNHRGQVFGYPGLFVLDGSTVPGPIGRNPSLTIAALAERAAQLIIQDGRRVQ